MPYTGHVPEYVYPGQAHLNGQSRSANGRYDQQHQIQQHPIQQQPQFNAGYGTLHHQNRTVQTAFTTPQYGQPSYYQAPPPAQYYRPYSSPTIPQTNFQGGDRLSPDPLQTFQPPPQPRQALPAAYMPQQQQSNLQRPPSHPSQTSQRHINPDQRQPLSQNQWQQFQSPSPRLPNPQLPVHQQHPDGPSRDWYRPEQPAYTGNPGNSFSHSQVFAQSGNQAQERPSQTFNQQAPHTQSTKYPSQSTPQMARMPSAQGQKPRTAATHQVNPKQQSQAAHHADSTNEASIEQSIRQKPPYSQPRLPPQQPSLVTPQQGTNRNGMHIKTEQRSAQGNRPSIKSEEPPLERSPKRRRSNDGHAVPLYSESTRVQHIKQKQLPPSKPSSEQLRTPIQASSSPRTGHSSAPHQPSPTTASTTISQQDILLALSDEYISAAYGMSRVLYEAHVLDENLDQYQRLLSTGMGCLDSVLKLHKIEDPKKEARIRLRLANLMFEETENSVEPAESLTKGISLCERARLVDLKYAMHHLLARIWHKSGKTKAAMNAVDKLIVEVEKLQLQHWRYAFRFLRVSFGIQSPGTHAETVALVRNLTAIHDAADKADHVSVQIVASTLEALVHLQSHSLDGVDLALRALAAIRTHQFTAEMTAMPQIRAFVDCIDLACSLLRFNRQVADAKMRATQASLDQSTRDQRWHEDGTFYLAVAPHRGVDIEAETGGIFKHGPDGDINLTFSWLTMNQIYGFAYLINGLALLDSNPANESKAEPFLSEALELTKRPVTAVLQSQSAASTRWRTSVSMRMVTRLYVAFAFSAKSDWEKALRALDAYKTKDVIELDCEPNKTISTLAIYLEALCKHGLGDTEGALKIYQSSQLQADFGLAVGQIEPLRILAALNSIELLRLLDRDAEADTLLRHTKQHCLVGINSTGHEYGSKALESAWYLLSAVASQRASGSLIIDTKQLLQRSVKAAQSITNNQLLCVIMNVMTDAFFKNIVGQQAEQSARAGRTLAHKIRNPLWSAVANKMYGDTLERSGRLKEAAQLHGDSQRNMRELHPQLSQVLVDNGKGKL